MKNWMMYSLLAVFTFTMAACGTNAKEQTTTSENAVVEVLSVNDFETTMKALEAEGQLQLVDVRTPEEVAAGALAGAIHIDYKADGFDEKIAKLDKTKPVMVYCRRGARSAAAAKICKDMGFPKVYDMGEGYDAWAAQH